MRTCAPRDNSGYDPLEDQDKFDERERDMANAYVDKLTHEQLTPAVVPGGDDVVTPIPETVVDSRTYYGVRAQQ